MLCGIITNVLFLRGKKNDPQNLTTSQETLLSQVPKLKAETKRGKQKQSDKYSRARKRKVIKQETRIRNK